MTAAQNAAYNCRAGFTFSGAPGTYGWSTASAVTIGGFSFFTTSFVANQPGKPNFVTLNSSITQVENNGASTGYLQIDLQAFDYTLPAGAKKFLTGSASLTQPFANAGDMIDSSFYADGTNNGFATNGVSCSMTGASNNSCKAPEVLWNSGPVFSMRDIVNYSVTAGSLVNTTVLSVVAKLLEPLSLSLVGIALLGAAASTRRVKRV